MYISKNYVYERLQIIENIIFSSELDPPSWAIHKSILFLYYGCIIIVFLLYS